MLLKIIHCMYNSSYLVNVISHSETTDIRIRPRNHELEWWVACRFLSITRHRCVRHWHVGSSTEAHGGRIGCWIGHCRSCECSYVGESGAKLIHRIQLSDGTSSHWSVNSEWLTMSINKKGNIVVSCWDLDKIIEFTPTGSCVLWDSVNAIDGTIDGLRHAFNWTDDRFLICHANIKHLVCIIDSNGRMMKSYGVGKGSGIREMNDPRYLAIDRNVSFLLLIGTTTV